MKVRIGQYFLMGVALASCSSQEQEGSQLKNYTNPIIITEDSYPILFQEREFDSWIKKEIETAEVSLQKAESYLKDEAKKRNRDLDGYLSTIDYTEFSRCLTGDISNSNECAGKSTLPPAVEYFSLQAIQKYTEVLNLLAGERRSEVELDQFVDNGCVGSLTEGERYLCEEIVLMTTLYEESYRQQFIYYFGKNPSDQEMDEENITRPEDFPEIVENSSDAFQKYILYGQMAEEIREKLVNYQVQIENKVLQLTQGQLLEGQVHEIPYLSVVGTPKDFLNWVEKYANKVQNSADNLLLKKEKIIVLRKNGLDTSNTKANYLEKISTLESNLTVNNIEDETLATEDDFFEESVAKTQAQIANTQRKFSTEMRSVLGNTNEVEFLNQFKVKLKPNSARADFPTVTIPVGFNGLIDINGGPTKYRANAVYHGEIEAYSWLSKGFKKAKRWVKKKVVPPLKQCALGGAVGGATGCLANVASGGKIGKAVKKHITPHKLDKIEIKNQNKIDKFMKQVPNQMVAMKSFLEIKPHEGNNYATMNQMIRELEDLPLPKLESNVVNAVTDLNGYLVSESNGVSSGRSTGTSTGKSKSIGVSMGTSKGYSNSNGSSINGGVSFVVSAGVGANIGKSESIGFSESVNKGESASQGTSTGLSVGKTAGLSIQVGYYHPNAEYPNLRLGMLVAEVYCGPSTADSSLMAIYPIGIKNFIPIDSQELTTENGSRCSEDLTLRLIVNDDLDHTHDICRPGFDCNSNDEIPIDIALYSDTQSNFKDMVDIFADDGFKQTVRDAAYSSDPVNNARNIFRQAANEKSIPSVLINKFMHVVDNAVSIQLDLKKLEEIALKRSKLSNSHKILEQKKVNLAAQLDFARYLVDNTNQSLDYQKNLEGLYSSEYEIERGKLLFYLERLSYWLGIYEKSKLYHNFSSLPIDVSAFIRGEFLRNLQGASTEEDIEDYRSDLKSKDLVEKIQQFISSEQDDSFVRDLVTQNKVGHCFIDFDTVIAKKLGIDGSSSEGVSSSIFSEEKFVASLGSASRDDDPDFNDNIYLDLSGQLTEQYGYRAVRFRTDPALASSNWLDPEEDSALKARSAITNPDAPLHCREASMAHLGKLLGVSFTYDHVGFGSPVSLQAYVARQPLTWSYVADSRTKYFSNEVGSRFYTFIDYTSLTDTWQWELRLKQAYPVNLLNSTNTLSSCRNDDASMNWHSMACMRTLLGDEVLDSKLSTPIKTSFYNQYLGGDWTLYLPNTPVYQELFQSLNGMKMHLYFTNRDLK
ncbi:hypothetical protein [Pseudobacteriovorax antillogorgiicola]|uniref:Uncharacterized protein n=1 Tax=Pseudobacteriovorax antillogorgiicola TaxID=1513793 RepID=A0A1Y6C160_9BACT|nr:hypothetical protein [Pseudobacteriovorax antillogorgiicola]TCS51133.1 hypothetical protein EDD56_11114 [Pseudobacteriovorax antillogorgiicola]SMF38438.1 hypothetical protein SAMN06296036_111163 [Pseudobacteriovorax antillogorgiicola]